MAPSKILAIKLRSMGDTVLMTAPLAELNRAYPHAEIHLVITTPWTSLFEGFPGVHKIWPFERKSNLMAQFQSTARLAYYLKKEKYDSVVNFHASPSSALLAYSTGADTRSIHFHGHQHKNRYSTVTIPGKGTLKPIIERDMDTVRALGLHAPAGRLPQIFLQQSEKQKASHFLERAALAAPILALGLGASRPTKSWPIERFAALAIEWRLKSQGGVIALAGPNEELLIQRFLEETNDQLTHHDSSVRAQVRSGIIGTSRLEVRALASILSQVAIVVANDSGPKHLAVAVDTPTVSLFGPEHPFEWHPYPKDRHPYFFIESLPCRKDSDPGMPPWCGLKKCELEDHKCMRQIGVERVLMTALQIAKRGTHL